MLDALARLALVRARTTPALRASRRARRHRRCSTRSPRTTLVAGAFTGRTRADRHRLEDVHRAVHSRANPGADDHARNTNAPTTIKESLGSTVAFDALANGEIDAYVDYSGTIWATIMRRSGSADRRRVLVETRAFSGRKVRGSAGRRARLRKRLCTRRSALPRARARPDGASRDLAPHADAALDRRRLRILPAARMEGHRRTIRTLRFASSAAWIRRSWYDAVARGTRQRDQRLFERRPHPRLRSRAPRATIAARSRRTTPCCSRENDSPRRARTSPGARVPHRPHRSRRHARDEPRGRFEKATPRDVARRCWTSFIEAGRRQFLRRAGAVRLSGDDGEQNDGEAVARVGEASTMGSNPLVRARPRKPIEIVLVAVLGDDGFTGFEAHELAPTATRCSNGAHEVHLDAPVTLVVDGAMAERSSEKRAPMRRD